LAIGAGVVVITLRAAATHTGSALILRCAGISVVARVAVLSRALHAVTRAGVTGHLETGVLGLVADHFAILDRIAGEVLTGPDPIALVTIVKTIGVVGTGTWEVIATLADSILAGVVGGAGIAVVTGPEQLRVHAPGLRRARILRAHLVIVTVDELTLTAPGDTTVAGGALVRVITGMVVPARGGLTRPQDRVTSDIETIVGVRVKTGDGVDTSASPALLAGVLHGAHASVIASRTLSPGGEDT